MNFDFSAFLVLATVLTGAIWGIDSLLFAKKRACAGIESEVAGDGASQGKTGEPVLVEYSRSFFPVLLIVLLVRSFLFEPFRIPSGSMMPTLLAGDFILVNKYTYGLRLPVVHTKLLEINRPQRGDVVVFRYPVDPSVDYIKRVIALPGDNIAYRDKTVLINGQPLAQSVAGIYLADGNAAAMNGAQERVETIGEITHRILVQPQRGSNFFPCLRNGSFTVPEGQYFVMGDNRDNSNDSRFWCTVPEQNLVGKAVAIWMSWDDGVVWNRLGNIIE